MSSSKMRTSLAEHERKMSLLLVQTWRSRAQEKASGSAVELAVAVNCRHGGNFDYPLIHSV